jgi:hypothetical protein
MLKRYCEKFLKKEKTFKEGILASESSTGESKSSRNLLKGFFLEIVQLYRLSPSTTHSSLKCACFMDLRFGFPSASFSRLLRFR